MVMGLKESKKYALGSVHENGGGKFEILDRWFDEETDTIMLKYKFLESGKVETNKEVNVNASEWKWRKVRGLAGTPKEEEPTPHPEDYTHWEELMEGIYVRLEKLFNEGRENVEKLITDNHVGVAKLEESILEHHKAMTANTAEILKIVLIQQSQIEQLVNDRSVVNKLLEKI